VWGYPTFFTLTFLLAIPATRCCVGYRWIGANGRHRGVDAGPRLVKASPATRRPALRASAGDSGPATPGAAGLAAVR